MSTDPPQSFMSLRLLPKIHRFLHFNLNTTKVAVNFCQLGKSLEIQRLARTQTKLFKTAQNCMLVLNSSQNSDVVLETRVLVSRRLEDKNESLGLGLEHLASEWPLGLGLEEKVLQFFKTFVVILDSSEQGTPWHFVRQQKQFPIRKPLFDRTFCALHAHQPQLRGYLTMGLFVRPHRRQ